MNITYVAIRRHYILTKISPKGFTSDLVNAGCTCHLYCWCNFLTVYFHVYTIVCYFLFSCLHDRFHNTSTMFQEIQLACFFFFIIPQVVCQMRDISCLRFHVSNQWIYFCSFFFCHKLKFLITFNRRWAGCWNLLAGLRMFCLVATSLVKGNTKILISLREEITTTTRKKK